MNKKAVIYFSIGLATAITCAIFAQGGGYPLNPLFNTVAIGARDTMVINGTTITSQLQVDSNTRSTTEMHSHSSAANSSPVIYGARSRGTFAAPTIVQQGDGLGRMYGIGYDGTDYALGGSFGFIVGSTPGNNDMPTNWELSLSADGSQNPTTRFSVNYNGVAIVSILDQEVSQNLNGSANSSRFQVNGTTGGSADAGLTRFAADSFGSVLQFGKSRGASVGTQTIVQSGDQLGRLFFTGSDGSAFQTGASITAQVDTTPGANDMPGRIVFGTTADGATSATERMRINSAGALGFNGANFGTAGQVLQSNGSTSSPTWVAASAGTPGGSNTQIQYNDAGAFGGASSLTFDNGTNTFASSGLVSLSNANNTLLLTTNAPTLRWLNTAGATDEKNYRCYASSTQFICDILSDDLATGASWLVLDRNTTTVGTLNFPVTDLQMNGLSVYRNEGGVGAGGSLTGTGFSGSVTPQYTCQVIDSGAGTSRNTLITISVIGFTGTSNATTFTLTGVDSACRPSTNAGVTVTAARDNGSEVLATATLSGTGVLTFGNGVVGGAWTASGTKGLPTQTVLTFSGL